MSSFMVRWLKLSLVVIVGCGFLAMMIYALLNRDEISSSQVEPPLIAAPTEPLKRRPDQPGGMQIPNRDKLVFDLLDSSNTTLGETGVGSVQTMPVTPTVEVTGANTNLVSDSVAAVEAVGMNVEAASTTEPAVVAPKAVAAVAPAVETVKPAEVKPVVAPKVEVKEPVKAAEKPVEKVEAKAEPKAAGGKWGVQLAAVNSMADGNAMTAKASKDFAALRSLTPRVSQVPNAKKYRVQFVGLKDRDAAAAVCAKLAGKQSCFPVSLQ